MANRDDHVLQSVKDALQEAEARGYQRGWDECMAAMVAAASKKKTNGGASPAPVSGEPEPYSVTVLRALTVKPGMSAPQIQTWLADKGLPSNKIAVRSALRRLLRQGRVEGRGAKFSPKVERSKEAANG